MPDKATLPDLGAGNAKLKAAVSSSAGRDEIKQLRAALKHVEMERDIQKKS